ncbi:TPA: hypothetical protein ACQZMJ_004444 [Klebsiella pneumoniae]
MKTTYPDYTIPADGEISLYAVFPDSTGKALLVQNKSTAKIVIRTTSNTSHDGFELVTPYSITVSSTGDIFIKNISYTSAVISVSEVE